MLNMILMSLLIFSSSSHLPHRISYLCVIHLRFKISKNNLKNEQRVLIVSSTLQTCLAL